jgi:hypothetical protein
MSGTWADRPFEVRALARCGENGNSGATCDVEDPKGRIQKLISPRVDGA